MPHMYAYSILHYDVSVGIQNRITVHQTNCLVSMAHTLLFSMVINIVVVLPLSVTAN
jgi:hypothetical protein